MNDADRLFKLILRCQTNRYKPDSTSFRINIRDGEAYVEARDDGIYMEEHTASGAVYKSCGTAISAANRLDLLGADFESVKMEGKQ